MLQSTFDPTNFKFDNLKVNPVSAASSGDGLSRFVYAQFGPVFPETNNISVVLGTPFSGCLFTGPASQYSGKLILVDFNSLCQQPVRAMHAQSLNASGLIFAKCSPAPPTFCNHQLNVLTVLSSYAPTPSVPFPVQYSIPKVTIPVIVVPYYDYVSMSNTLAQGIEVTMNIPGSGPIKSSSEVSALALLGKQVPWSSPQPGSVTLTQFSNNQSIVEPCSGYIYGVRCKNGYVSYLVFHMSTGSLSGSFGYNIFQSFSKLRILAVLRPIRSTITLQGLNSFETLFASAGGSFVFNDSNSFLGCSSLKVIQLPSSRLSSLPDLSNAVELRYLNLDGNSLREFPNISSSSQLWYLSLFNNKIIGTIPSFTNFFNLMYVDISRNFLNGSVEDKFDNLRNLVAIDLSYNEFTGRLPKFENTSALIEINMMFNKFNGPIGCSWDIPPLTRLNVQNNNFTFPVCVLQFSKLDFLDFSTNSVATVTDVIPFMQNMPPSLSFLNISSNKYQFSFANGVNLPTRMTNLKTFIMSYNQLSSLPSDLFSSSNVPPYQTLDFSFCNIRGSIPNWVLTQNIQNIILGGNPNLKSPLLRLPSFADIDSSMAFVYQNGEVTCPSVISSGVFYKKVNIQIDPSYTNFSYCSCQRGYYGLPPYCRNIPLFANASNGIITDKQYGQSRLMPGIVTSWFVSSSKFPVIIFDVQFLKDFSKSSDNLEIFEVPFEKTGNQIFVVSGDNIGVSRKKIKVYSQKAILKFSSLQFSGQFFNASYDYISCDNGYNELVQSSQFPLSCYLLFNYSAALTITIVCVSIFTFLVILLVSFVIFRKRQSLIVKSSSVPFCLAMLAFLLLMAVGSIFYSISPRNLPVCDIRPWITTMSLCGVLSALLVKADRIRKIFNSTELVVQAITNKQLFQVMAIMMMIQLIIMICFSSLQVYSYQRSLGSGVTAMYIVDSCEGNLNAANVWFGVQATYISLFLIAGVFEAWGVRKVPTAFNEGPHIASCLLSIFALLIILTPLNFIVNDNPDALVLIRGLGQNLIALIITLFLFGPKLFYILEGRENDKQLSSIGSQKSSSSSSSSSVSSNK